MKKLLLLLIPSLFLNAQVGLEYYLGDLSEYNNSIPTPSSIIGHEVGEFHISHDKLSHYIQEISRSSKRVKLIASPGNAFSRTNLNLSKLMGSSFILRMHNLSCVSNKSKIGPLE